MPRKPKATPKPHRYSLTAFARLHHQLRDLNRIDAELKKQVQNGDRTFVTKKAIFDNNKKRGALNRKIGKESTFLISEVLNVMSRTGTHFMATSSYARTKIRGVFEKYIPTVHKMMTTKVELDLGTEGNTELNKALEMTPDRSQYAEMHENFRLISKLCTVSYHNHDTCNPMRYWPTNLRVEWKNRNTKGWSSSSSSPDYLDMSCPDALFYYVYLQRENAQMVLWNQDSLFSKLPLEIKAIIIQYLMFLPYWSNSLQVALAMLKEFDAKVKG